MGNEGREGFTVISLILLILAAIAKALMDAVAHGKLGKGHPWLDPELSWLNKWHLDPDKGLQPSGWPAWIPFRPIYRERWFTSSTATSFATDGWHFFQFLFLNLSFAAALPYAGLLNVVIARVSFGVAFQLVYSLLERKKHV
jgi:hypothetical protein